jgi:hypothetical protein
MTTNETTARPGDLIMVVGGGGALDGLDKVRETYHLRVAEVTERPNLRGWAQIEGRIEEPGRRFRNIERMILARPNHYVLVEAAR